jgi:hypothetical protein
MSNISDLILTFKDKKNDKYGLKIMKKENITEQFLKYEFQKQFSFDSDIIELSADGKKINHESYDTLSKKKLIISNIQHERIIKSNIKRNKVKYFQNNNFNDFNDDINENNDNLNIRNIKKQIEPEKNFSIFNDDISEINTNKKIFDSFDDQSFFENELQDFS